MQTRSKKTPGTAPKNAGPKNAIEAGIIAPPIAVKKGFQSLTSLPVGWGKASDTLDRVRAVETCFPDFDRATRIGGIPLRRIITIHGPTHGGKTAFIMGLLRSFVDVGHIGGYVDAEHATDLSFVDGLFEQPVKNLPNFMAKRPTNYEETIDACDEFLKYVTAERKARFGKFGKAPIPPEENLAGLLVIDSLNKLTPKREIEQLKKTGGEALDKGWGRLRANFNQAFLDHIVPMLGPAETALGIIVQEREDDDLDPWEMPKLKGGRASQYDASMIIRVMKGAEVKRGEKESKEVFGFKHKLIMWKSKVGQMDGKASVAHFHMSNGKLIREGFDIARDTVSLGVMLKIVDLNGTWLTWKKNRWQGEHNAVVALMKKPDLLFELLAQVRKAIRPSEVEL